MAPPFFPAGALKDFAAKPVKALKLVCTDAAVESKEDLADALFWIKQALAVVVGVLLTLIQAGAISGLSLGAGAMLLVCKQLKVRRNIKDEVMEESSMLGAALPPALQTLLLVWCVAWTVIY